MKLIKLVCIILSIIILSNTKVYSQDESLIKNKEINFLIIKNFISYQTYRILQTQLDLIKNGQASRINFGRHLIDTNQFYEIKVTSINNLQFYLNNYKLFELRNFNRVYTKNYDSIANNYYPNNIGMSGRNIIYKFNITKNAHLL